MRELLLMLWILYAVFSTLILIVTFALSAYFCLPEFLALGGIPYLVSAIVFCINFIVWPVVYWLFGRKNG